MGFMNAEKVACFLGFNPAESAFILKILVTSSLAPRDGDAEVQGREIGE